MRTYRIYLIRHGIIKSNIDGRYVGVTDEELCEVGKTHLLKLLENNEYPNVGKVYSSSLKRCLQTANIIYPQMPVHALDGLKEYNFGEFENKTISELLHNEKYINFIENNFKQSNSKEPVISMYNDDGSEKMESFNYRVYSALDFIIKDMMKEKISDAAVITHGGVIMTLLGLCGIPKRKASDWVTKSGEGYTLVCNASLWANTAQVEVFSPVPYKKD